MAFITEDSPRSGVSPFSIITWLMVLALVGAGAYYLLKKPEVVNRFVGTEAVQRSERVSQIRLNPDDVKSDPKFKNLTSFTTWEQVQKWGKDNPFLPL